MFWTHLCGCLAATEFPWDEVARSCLPGTWGCGGGNIRGEQMSQTTNALMTGQSSGDLACVCLGHGGDVLRETEASLSISHAVFKQAETI